MFFSKLTFVIIFSFKLTNGWNHRVVADYHSSGNRIKSILVVSRSDRWARCQFILAFVRLMVSDIDTSLLILLLLGLRLVDFLCNYQSLKNANLTIAAFFLKVDHKAIKTKDGTELEPC